MPGMRISVTQVVTNGKPCFHICRAVPILSRWEESSSSSFITCDCRLSHGLTSLDVVVGEDSSSNDVNVQIYDRELDLSFPPGLENSRL